MIESNTPKDGDFVRYVEELTSSNRLLALSASAAQTIEDPAYNASSRSTTRKPHTPAQPVQPVVRTAGALPPPVPASVQKKPDFLRSQPGLPQAAGKISADNPFAGLHVLTHVKWLVVAWVALQVLKKFVPFAGMLFLPILVADLAWIFYTANKNSSGGLVKRISEFAEAASKAAAEKARQQAAKDQAAAGKK